MTDWFKQEYQRLEFRKGALALLPDEGDNSAGIAYHVFQDKKALEYGYCTCIENAERTCLHKKNINRIIKEFRKSGVNNLSDLFRQSVWDMLAGILNDAMRFPREQTRVIKTTEDTGMIRLQFFQEDTEAATYTSTPERATILLDRLGLESPPSHSRRDALDKLDLLSLSENERIMLHKGIKTRRQTLEGSFWYSFCYHLFFDWDFDDAGIKAAIHEKTGEFFIEPTSAKSRPLFTMTAPRQSVPHVLLGLKSSLDNAGEFTVSTTALRSILKMSLTKKKDLRMALWFRFSPAAEEASVYSRERLVPFTYGELVYLKDKTCFARIEKPDALFEKFKGNYSRIIRQEKIPEGLDNLGEAFWGRKGLNIVDDSLKNLSIYKTHDRLAIDSRAMDRNWFYLSMDYGFGKSRISIRELIRAKKEGRRFIPVDKGWVDVRSIDTDAVCKMPGLDLRDQIVKSEEPLKLSLADIFRVMAGSGKPTDITGQEKESMDRMVSMRSVDPPAHIPGLTSTLRDYQFKGVHWLIFLLEHGLSGILCDDMGLGKTHQVMALMVFLKNVKQEKKPSLVVAPVTVLSHWETKLNQYAPSLKIITHHGLERDVAALKGHDVILTSFGVLRRDSFDSISDGFSLAVFDEAQHLKNSRTLVYRAAWAIRADMKLCVTGTPVENSLTELKALMDIAVPGYLGPDDAFESRYVRPIMLDNNRARREELSRLVTPFTLRRMKKTVLLELPEKIEDVRTCRLSEDQIKLYRQAIADKGRDFRQMMERSDTIPYIHIFALLTMLKQICNHPAQALKIPDQADAHESGKWELFKEILDQALESGQKIVIYSQYVDMIRIMEKYLKTLGVNAVILTGASRKRGDIVRRFNEDPDCRVFVGSLLAGGTGIDLVSASVVIHYDRWWNAAKEDQATDRVHRIGQRRGVQVFKLVTQGTLEEKISAIIEKKKNLMDSVVQEDDPHLLKAFTREQLIGLLSMPDE